MSGMDKQRFFAPLRMTEAFVAAQLGSEVNSPWASQGATKAEEGSKKCS